MAVSVSILMNAAYADTVQGVDETNDTPETRLETWVIHVKSPFSQQMGTQALTASKIAELPSTNTNLTDLLKTNPNVRFANRADSSNTAGEIAPNEVSIHGAKFYDNNFTIDGLSNNDNINPAANNGQLSANSPDGYSPTDLPAGGTQSFWVDSSLIKDIEVFDANISAQYGKLTGGLVNANLKDPNTLRASGRVSYRTTRDAWASYHIKEDDAEEFYQASRISYQPQFTKNQYSVSLNQPISDKTAVMVSYNRSESDMPYYDTQLQEWQEQSRLSETFLLKGSHALSDTDSLKATLMYSPHASLYPKQGIKNGYFTNTGGGYRANLEWLHKADWGEVTSYAGYQKTGNEIKHDGDSYHNYRSTSSLDWCSTRSSSGVCTFARWGGYGEFETAKETYTLKEDYDFVPLVGSSITHDIKTGWQFDRASASYERLSDVYTYSVYSTANAANITDCTECIAGEQYATTRMLYPARSVSAQDNSFAAYIEDSMTWGRLNLVAGLRSDYSQYLGNIDVSPRLSFTYDVFGDKSLRLFGGANRYYGGSMLAYKLRNEIGTAITQTRRLSGGVLTDWATTRTTTGSASNSYDVSSLDTPYSDELNVGIAKTLGNSLWTAKWVGRDHKDAFTRATMTDVDGSRFRILTNDGHSKNQNFTLSVKSISPFEIGAASIGWELGASYSKSQSNNSYYEDTAIESDGIEYAVYRGELISADAVPLLDFNSPWQAYLSINTNFADYGINWSQRFGYKDGYRSLRRTTITCDSTVAGCGDYTGQAYLYTDEDNANGFTWDWRVAYTKTFANDHSLTLTADINNILNKTIAVGSPTGSSSNTGQSYQLGRNLWLGVSYDW